MRKLKKDYNENKIYSVSSLDSILSINETLVFNVFCRDVTDSEFYEKHYRKFT